MSRETIKDGKMNTVGFVDKTCHGTRISDRNNNIKGHTTQNQIPQWIKVVS